MATNSTKHSVDIKQMLYGINLAFTTIDEHTSLSMGLCSREIVDNEYYTVRYSCTVPGLLDSDTDTKVFKPGYVVLAVTLKDGGKKSIVYSPQYFSSEEQSRAHKLFTKRFDAIKYPNGCDTPYDFMPIDKL
jgi:hypothetical protein